MEFDVRQNLHDCNSNGLWYVGRTVNVDEWEQEYIWNDLTVKSFCSDAGYYATKAEAERYLMAYRVKGMKFEIEHTEFGWYVSPTDRIDGEFYYLWKTDLELHIGNTGYTKYGKDAPGYYRTKEVAEYHLRKFKEKHSMIQDNLEINVKLNGVDTPLHKISEQTLLNIREASKPKSVPVFQVAKWDFYEELPRFVLKVTGQIRARIKDNPGHDFIVFDEDGDVVASYYEIEGVDSDYSDRCELKLDEV